MTRSTNNRRSARLVIVIASVAVSGTGSAAGLGGAISRTGSASGACWSSQYSSTAATCLQLKPTGQEQVPVMLVLPSGRGRADMAWR